MSYALVDHSCRKKCQLRSDTLTFCANCSSDSGAFKLGYPTFTLPLGFSIQQFLSGWVMSLLNAYGVYWIWFWHLGSWRDLFWAIIGGGRLLFNEGIIFGHFPFWLAFRFWGRGVMSLIASDPESTAFTLLNCGCVNWINFSLRLQYFRSLFSRTSWSWTADHESWLASDLNRVYVAKT